MNGLLDTLQSDNPAVARGLLDFGLAMLQGRGNFGNAVGQAGMVGLAGADRFNVRDQALKRAALNDQYIGLQMKNMQQGIDQNAQAAALQRLPGQFMRAPSAPAIDATGGMDTAAENPANASGPGGFDMPGYLRALTAAPGGGPLAALQMQQAFQRQVPQPIKLGKGDQLLDSVSYKPIASNIEAEKINPNLPFMLVDGKIVPNKAYQDYELAKAEKSGTRITNSVNTGQKGLDNTLKLRGDFRSEPVYKAHQEMQSAYAQIQQSLKQASPAGDLAGATKIMKLLDPGSVVRESELGMAMAASGLMDRAQNYASMVMNGTKLTPTQRKDFQTLADALYGESVKQYNGKRKEYEGIASRNGLSVPDVLGSESTAPAKDGGWSMTQVP